MKLCKDCRYCGPGGEYARCAHPVARKKYTPDICPVTGRDKGTPDITNYFCSTMRDVGECEKRARYFEPIPEVKPPPPPDTNHAPKSLVQRFYDWCRQNGS